jgi:hypothetical protein
MKTVRIINRLRELSENPKNLKVKDCANLLRLAAERLEELSTGVLPVTAEIAKKIYTIDELAKMYDCRCQYSQEQHSEILRLRARIEEFEENESKITDKQ